jgi:predicted amidohydrolase YtcJ
MVSDGALGSWGASMIQPYTDNPSKSGLFRLPKDVSDISKLILRVMRQGYQVNIHCIGDLANRLVLDGFEEAKKVWDGEKESGDQGKLSFKEWRNRIEHSQIVDVEDLKRFGELGVIPSVQPTHG